MLRLCLCVLVWVAGSQGQIREPDWGFQSYLDEDYTFTCNHSSIPLQPNNNVLWELPSGGLVERNSDKYVLTDDGSVVHLHLTIKNVKETDSGVYLCHIFENWVNRRGRLLRGLNIGGHLYRDPFDEYRSNLMVAGIATAALLVPLMACCFIYKFRYQTTEDRAAKYAQRENAFKHQREFERSNGPEKELSDSGGVNNVAYENEEKSTKL